MSIENDQTSSGVEPSACDVVEQGGERVVTLPEPVDSDLHHSEQNVSACSAGHRNLIFCA